MANNYNDYRNERLKVGDIVQHFKREHVEDKSHYLYKILGFA